MSAGAARAPPPRKREVARCSVTTCRGARKSRKAARLSLYSDYSRQTLLRIKQAQHFWKACKAGEKQFAFWSPSGTEQLIDRYSGACRRCGKVNGVAMRAVSRKGIAIQIRRQSSTISSNRPPRSNPSPGNLKETFLPFWWRSGAGVGGPRSVKSRAQPHTIWKPL